jgi:3-isopropylmalate/(R)-2-methylmalate dehydratase small subunit
VNFARIFEENCYNNGVVPIKLSEAEIQEIDKALTNDTEVEIDVIEQVLNIGAKTYKFNLDELKKEFILRGGFMKFLDAKVPKIKEWALAENK